MTEMTPDARRALAANPICYALSADAAELADVIELLAEQLHGPYTGAGQDFPCFHQRWVPIRLARAVFHTGGRFDRAAAELADVYRVWLRVNWESTAADDATSVYRRGTDYHLITVDGWR